MYAEPVAVQLQSIQSTNKVVFKESILKVLVCRKEDIILMSSLIGQEILSNIDKVAKNKTIHKTIKTILKIRILIPYYHSIGVILITLMESKEKCVRSVNLKMVVCITVNG